MDDRLSARDGLALLRNPSWATLVRNPVKRAGMLFRWLHDLRVRKNVSQTILADRMGVGRWYVCRIENGIRRVMAGDLAAYLHHLEATDEERLQALLVAGVSDFAPNERKAA